jgi:hypothetical protein
LRLRTVNTARLGLLDLNVSSRSGVLATTFRQGVLLLSKRRGSECKQCGSAHYCYGGFHGYLPYSRGGISGLLKNSRLRSFWYQAAKREHGLNRSVVFCRLKDG